MKFVGITQRVDVIENYKERRDGLDQAWKTVCDKLNMIMIPLANQQKHVDSLLSHLNLDLIILSGGNSISTLDDSHFDVAYERDLFETSVLDFAVKNNIPVLGVCRGMQFINYYFGGSLVKISGHVATKHKLLSCKAAEAHIPEFVNSYHQWGIAADGLASRLQALACDNAGHIEAFNHFELPILGIMWHPERIPINEDITLTLIKRYLV